MSSFISPIKHFWFFFCLDFYMLTEVPIINFHSYALAFIWVVQVADALERNEQVWSVIFYTSNKLFDLSLNYFRVSFIFILTLAIIWGFFKYMYHMARIYWAWVWDLVLMRSKTVNCCSSAAAAPEHPDCCLKRWNSNLDFKGPQEIPKVTQKPKGTARNPKNLRLLLLLLLLL